MKGIKWWTLGMVIGFTLYWLIGESDWTTEKTTDMVFFMLFLCLFHISFLVYIRIFKPTFALWEQRALWNQALSAAQIRAILSSELILPASFVLNLWLANSLTKWLMAWFFPNG